MTKEISRNVLLGLCLLFSTIFSSDFNYENYGLENKESGWKVFEDGTYSFLYNEILLDKCFPSINGNSIRPISFKIKNSNDKSEIIYTLNEGEISVQLSEEKGMFVVETCLKGFRKPIYSVCPIASAEITGANRFYRQGFGFAGPSGVMEIPKPIEKLEWSADLKENVWSYDSYLFSGLISENNSTIVLSVFDNKNFLHRSTFYNRQYRYGLIDKYKDTDKIYLDSGFELEGIEFENDNIILPKIFFQTGDNPYKTFRQHAVNMKNANDIDLNISPRKYFCSWYEFQKEFSDSILTGLLEGLSKMDERHTLQTIQLDDGYAYYGDWLSPTEKYPKGLSQSISKIINAGYNAGIWVAPYMVSSKSFIFNEHKDWLLKDASGQIILEWDNKDEQVYVLDSSNPDAFNYLRKVFKEFKQMGISTFKTDFMDWGMRDSKSVTRSVPGKTSVQYFVDVLEMIREEIGGDSYWLGCISPFQPMVGFVDGMRLSNDVGHNWSYESTGNMFRELSAGQFFNNVLWQNDPDVLYLRDYSTEFTKSQKTTIALFDGMLGGTLTTSCRFPTLTKENLKLWDFVRFSSERFTAAMPFWAVNSDVLVLVKKSNDVSIVLFTNISDKPIKAEYYVKDICDIENAFCFEYNLIDKKEPGKLSKINVELNPYESRLVYLSGSEKLPGINKKD
ncbi:MAG: alpha-galactosidase [Melioribacteraceae bacterium]|nr:alpha-galactosidase [Melioribacteraceae bacterium]